MAALLSCVSLSGGTFIRDVEVVDLDSPTVHHHNHIGSGGGGLKTAHIDLMVLTCQSPPPLGLRCYLADQCTTWALRFRATC